MPSFLDLPLQEPVSASPVKRLAELFFERFFYNDLARMSHAGSSKKPPSLA